jgi:gamma-tubulin complex component 3
MLDHTDGEIGWEVFTLVYKVDAPIDTVLDPDAMIQYQRLFNHLWKMKRVDSELTSGWTRLSRARKQFAGSLPGTSASDMEFPVQEFLILFRVHAHLARN